MRSLIDLYLFAKVGKCICLTNTFTTKNTIISLLLDYIQFFLDFTGCEYIKMSHPAMSDS